MDSIESELLSKLVNVFSFNFKKNYQDLTKSEFVDVYKLLLKCYDESWVLNADQPDKKHLKQIQGYLKILELGHLIAREAKFEELIDPKKNARLLGGLISKLESRHPGAKLQGVIRKIKLAKPKALPAKRNQRLKDNSSGSSAGEEAKEEELVAEEELVVPTKGKEIPRTPPVGGKTNVNGEEFRKPKPARSPRSQALSAATTAASKNFQPILPTKEIPRTPLKGVWEQPIPTEDISVLSRNPNLTVDFSVSRLTSSNTSTPYEERSSKSPQCDATFLVPPKLSSDLHDSTTSPTEVGNISPGTRAIRRGTFVKQTTAESQQKGAKKMSEEHDSLKLEAEDVDDQHEPDAQASPEIPETKRRGGRQPKNANAKKNDKLETSTSEVTDSKAENPDAPSSPGAKGKKGRGKKAVTPVAAEDPPAQVTETAEPGPKGNKKRGKKGKNNAQPKPEAPVADEPAPEEPIAEEAAAEKPTAEEPVTEKSIEEERATEKPIAEEPATDKSIAEEPASDKPIAEESAPEESVPEVKGKKGRGKAAPKAVAKASVPVPEKPSENEQSVEEATETPKAEEDDKLVEEVKASPSVQAKKGRARKGKQQEPDTKEQDEPKEDAKEETEEVEETPAVTTMAPPPVPEVKKGRGKQVKEPVSEPAPADEPVEENESAVPEVPDTKAKKGRGKKGKADEAPAAKSEAASGKESTAPELNKTAKNGRKAASKVVTEPTRKSSRNKPEAAKPYEELEHSAEDEPANEPEAQTKGRGKKGKADVKAEEQVGKVEAAEDKKKRKNKKVDDSTAAEEPETKAAQAPKGKRNNKRNDPKATKEPTEDAVEKASAVKSPERALRLVNGADDEVSSPSKRKQQEDDSAAAAEDAPPEKKKRARGAKKDTVQPTQMENLPPAVEEAPVKKAAKKGKETLSEVDKKKTTGRKKAADTLDDDADESISPSKPKRAAKSTPQVDKDDKEDGASVFVSYIAGQQSADPSPAAPPAGKGRRLKMVEESPSATPESPKKAPATAKRGGRARKAK